MRPAVLPLAAAPAQRALRLPKLATAGLAATLGLLATLLAVWGPWALLTALGAAVAAVVMAVGFLDIIGFGAPGPDAGP